MNSPTFIKIISRTLLIFMVSASFLLIVVIRDDYKGLRQKVSSIPFFSTLIMQRKKAIILAKAFKLNHEIPSLTLLARYINGQEENGAKVAESYMDYYKKVVESFPQFSEGQGLLGFCHYYAGAEQEAMLSLARAITLNPNIFWHYYNLGAIYFNQGQYEKSINVFGKGITLKPETVLKVVSHSKVYRQIIYGNKGVNFGIGVNLKEGYKNAYLLIAESYYRLGKQFYAVKKYNEAARFFKESIAIIPQQSESYEYLSLIYLSSGDKKTAKEFREKGERVAENLFNGIKDKKIALRIF